jgi:hypothetical protein
VVLALQEMMPLILFLKYHVEYQSRLCFADIQVYSYWSKNAGATKTKKRSKGQKVPSEHKYIFSIIAVPE